MAEGYFVDHATDALPNFDRNQEVFNLFGLESPEVDVQHVTGTLSITLLDKYVNNALLDLLTVQDPLSTGVREYNVDALDAIGVWANVKNQQNTAYIRSWMVEGWTPGLPVPSGDANAKAQYVIQGPSELPREFEGAWIHAAKVASGAATLGATQSDYATPVVVPNSGGIYAVAIRALDESAGFAQEDVKPTAAMVDASGAVDFTAINDAVTTPGFAATHAYVKYLQTGTGVYPNIRPGRLRDS